MSFKHVASSSIYCLRICLAAIALFQFTIGASLADAAPPQNSRDTNTVTPIKHVIVIIGENRSFAHVFATYVPQKGQTVNNLLSEGIIKLDSNKNALPGPNFSKAQQVFAEDYGTFLLDPPSQPFAGNVMPPALAGGPSGANGYFAGANPCDTKPALTALECAQETESGLPTTSYYQDLASGGTGLTKYTPDTRISNVNS